VNRIARAAVDDIMLPVADFFSEGSVDRPHRPCHPASWCGPVWLPDENSRVAWSCDLHFSGICIVQSTAPGSTHIFELAKNCAVTSRDFAELDQRDWGDRQSRSAGPNERVHPVSVTASLLSSKAVAGSGTRASGSACDLVRIFGPRRGQAARRHSHGLSAF
jgi:hypothetical protein